MKTLKDLSEKDKEALVQGAIAAHFSPIRAAFWDEVDRLLNESAANKAPNILPRLTNSPKRGTYR